VGKSGAGMYGDFTMMMDAEIGRILASCTPQVLRP
jgi:hypothetical protein